MLWLGFDSVAGAEGDEGSWSLPSGTCSLLCRLFIQHLTHLNETLSLACLMPRESCEEGRGRPPAERVTSRCGTVGHILWVGPLAQCSEGRVPVVQLKGESQHCSGRQAPSSAE